MPYLGSVPLLTVGMAGTSQEVDLNPLYMCGDSPSNVWLIQSYVTTSSCCPNRARHRYNLLGQSHRAISNWPDAPGYLRHSGMLLHKFIHALYAAKKRDEKQQP